MRVLTVPESALAWSARAKAIFSGRIATVAGSALAAIIPGYSGYRTHEWKYIEYDSGERELYDLINDPYEMNNLIDTPAYDQIILSLQLQLQELKSQ